MLNQTENNVKIEGILSEVDLESGSYQNKTTGKTMESISGQIKVRVDQVINGENVTLEIPVHLFANKYTSKGAPNPAYASIEKVKNEFVSIAATDMERADRIRITGANIRMNEYYNKNGQLVSFPRITASFINKVSALEMKPEATFSATFVIGSMNYETDAEGIENPNKFKIRGILPQYGGSVDVVDFFAISPNTIDGVNSMWNQGDTVNAVGKLNFTSTTEERKVEVAFGDPRVEKRTVSVSEFIITGGTPPMEGDYAIDNEAITSALAERQARLAQLKEKGQNKTVPAPAKKNNFDNLGF